MPEEKEVDVQYTEDTQEETTPEAEDFEPEDEE